MRHTGMVVTITMVVVVTPGPRSSAVSSASALVRRSRRGAITHRRLSTTTGRPPATTLRHLRPSTTVIEAGGSSQHLRLERSDEGHPEPSYSRGHGRAPRPARGRTGAVLAGSRAARAARRAADRGRLFADGWTRCAWQECRGARRAPHRRAPRAAAHYPGRTAAMEPIRRSDAR